MTARAFIMVVCARFRDTKSKRKRFICFSLLLFVARACWFDWNDNKLRVCVCVCECDEYL